MSALNTAILWAINAAFFVSLIAPFIIRTYWPWTQSSFTRLLMGVEFLVALALLPGILRRTFDVPINDTFFAWFELVVIAAIPVRTIWMAFSIYRLQKQGVIHDPDELHPRDTDAANGARSPRRRRRDVRDRRYPERPELTEPAVLEDQGDKA